MSTEAVDHPDDAGASAREIERLRGEQSDIAALLLFIQELTSSILGAGAPAELFQAAFEKLAERFRFDVAAAVMVEQSLELHVAMRPDFNSAVDQRFVDDIRAALENCIPLSFGATDVVVRSERAGLPLGTGAGDPLSNRIHTSLRDGSRTAGVLVLYRAADPFAMEHQRMLELLAVQVGIVLENLRSQQKIQNLADTDDLTGIWNRRYFRRQLPAEVERARIYSVPLSLLMFDIDEFKEINDRYGHTTADVVLSELCGTVREMLRPPDLFARFGGDEFAVILPHTDLQGAISVADRLVRRVREVRVPAGEGEFIHCSVSVGVASYHPPEDSVAGLTRRADEQLYLAKRHGKNRYSY